MHPGFARCRLSAVPEGIAGPCWGSFPMRGYWAVLRNIILTIGTILLLWTSSATAQRRSAVGHCLVDLKRLCPGIDPGEGRLRACMREHIGDVSYPCLVTLAKFAEVYGYDQTCRAHLKQQCATVSRKGGQFGVCLKSAIDSLSDSCKDELQRALHRAISRR